MNLIFISGLFLFFSMKYFYGRWENGFKTCMVSSRGWHGSLSSTIYCSRSPGLLHLLCKPSFISCPGHLGSTSPTRVPKYEAPGPLSLHCPYFFCSNLDYSFHVDSLDREFLSHWRIEVLTCHSLLTSTCLSPSLEDEIPLLQREGQA